MDEILQKLLSSELLSEEAKADISTKWTSAVDQYKELVREEVTMDVRAEIAEQWTNERDALIEKVDAFVTAKLKEESEELRADIERFRDLEAEHAEKLVEARHEMADKLSEELEQLVNKMDAFFELRLTEEFAELREDIEVVKKNEFGRRIFEAFATEFNTSYVDEESIQSQLAATAAKLEDAQQVINKLEEAKSQLVRESTLGKILAPLSGKKREQMEFVLANVETGRLEEAFNYFIGRVLKEDASPAAPAIAAPAALSESATSVVTGDELSEAAAPTAPTIDKHSALKKLAGITH
jgi:hypothetical protein